VILGIARKPFSKNNSKTEISSRGEQELMPDGVTAIGVLHE